MVDLYTERRPELPLSYVSFIEGYGEWEGDLGNDLGYVMLWDKAAIQECYVDCEMAEYLNARWFPFGSNGGGEMLCFDLLSGTDQVYWIPYIGMSDEAAMPLYDSFAEVAVAVRKNAKQGGGADGTT